MLHFASVRGPSGFVLYQRVSENFNAPVLQPVEDGKSTWRDRIETHQIDREDSCSNTEGSHS